MNRHGRRACPPVQPTVSCGPVRSCAIQRFLSAVVAVTVAWPTQAAAAPFARALTSTLAPEPMSNAEKLAQAKLLYAEGTAKYDLADYEGAVEIWTRAYALLPPEEAVARNNLIYNIASAQEKAFDVDHELKHLRQAVILFDAYIEDFKLQHDPTPETREELLLAKKRVRELRARIAQVEGAAAPTVVTPTPAPAPVITAPAPNPELEAKNRRLAQEGRKVDAMLISSYVLASIAGVAFLASAVPFGQSAVATGSRASSFRTRGYIWVGVGGALVVTAAALMITGFRKRKKLREGRLSLAPTFSPRGAGMGATIRF